MPETKYAWIIAALLGAVFAALVQITSKRALDKIDPSAVNLIRAIVMTVMFIAVVSYERVWSGLTTMQRPLLWAVVSGIAAGLSWFFGYWALKLSSVTKSYPIDKLSVVFAIGLAFVFLGERPSGTNWIGIAMMIGGAFLVTQK